MSSNLGRMLASSGRVFDFLIDDFEKAVGNKDLDVALIGEVATQASVRLRELKLSPNDTLPKELVAALSNKLSLDAEVVDHQVVGHNRDINFYNLQLVRLLNDILDQSIYRLSDKTLMRLAQAAPPAKLMKKLKLKTVDAAVKQFNLVEFLTVAWRYEDIVWREAIVEQVSKLSASDYQIAEIYFVALDPALAKVDKGDDNFIRNSLLGTVMFKNYSSVPPLGILDGVLDGLKSAKRLIDESNQLQFIVASRDYHELIQNWLLHRANLVWQINGSLLPWRSVLRAIAEPGELNREMLKRQPKFKFAQLDISDEIAEQFLHFRFWEDNDYLAFRYRGQAISLSLLDVAESNYSKSEYGSRRYFEEALWDELLRRYLNQSNLASRTVMFACNNLLKSD